jgi:hypothetical protein
MNKSATNNTKLNNVDQNTGATRATQYIIIYSYSNEKVVALTILLMENKPTPLDGLNLNHMIYNRWNRFKNREYRQSSSLKVECYCWSSSAPGEEAE